MLFFSPCVLLPSRVSFLGLFFFPSLGKCLHFFLHVNTWFFSSVLLDSVGSCLCAHTHFSPHSWTELGMCTHMHALYVHMCTHMCTYMTPLTDSVLFFFSDNIYLATQQALGCTEATRTEKRYLARLWMCFANYLRDGFCSGHLLNSGEKWGGLDGAILCVVPRPLLQEEGPSGHSSTSNLFFPL